METTLTAAELEALFSKSLNELTDDEIDARRKVITKDSDDRTPEEKAVLDKWSKSLQAKWDAAPSFLLFDSFEVSAMAVRRAFGKRMTDDASGEPWEQMDQGLIESVMEVLNRERYALPLEPVLTPEERQQHYEDALQESGKERADEVMQIVPPDMEFWSLCNGAFNGRITDPDELRNWFFRDMSKCLEDVFIKMKVVEVNGMPRLRYKTNISLSARQTLALIILMLLDDTHDYGRRLCKCKLDKCRKFFFESQNAAGGPRRRAYCTSEHMLEAHNRTASERVKRSREKKKEAQKQPRMRRRHK